MRSKKWECCIKTWLHSASCSIFAEWRGCARATERVAPGDPRRLHRVVGRRWLINDEVERICRTRGPSLRRAVRRRPLIKQRLVAAASVVNLSEHCRRLPAGAAKPTGRAGGRVDAVEKKTPRDREMRTGCVRRRYTRPNGRIGHISFNRCFFRVPSDPCLQRCRCDVGELLRCHYRRR